MSVTSGTGGLELDWDHGAREPTFRERRLRREVWDALVFRGLVMAGCREGCL